MSTKAPRTPEELDRILTRLPHTSASAGGAHADDGELIAYRASRAFARGGGVPGSPEARGGGVPGSPEARGGGVPGSPEVPAISEARAAEIELHLADCKDCRELLAELTAAESNPFPLPIPLTSRRPRRIAIASAVGATVLAMAASVMLVFQPSATSSAPEYRIRSVRGAIAEMRGAEQPALTERLAVDENSRVQVVLEPALDLEGPAPRVSAYVAREGGPLMRVAEDQLSRGEGGAVKLEAKADALFRDGPGTYTIYAIVGGTDAAGALAGVTAVEAQQKTRGAQWLTVTVEARSSTQQTRERGRE